MDPSVKKLLAWYGRFRRDLPWRKTRDPYRIFVSELMLQQTQVERVVPKYRAWIRRFPTWKDLTRAKTTDLIRAWAGLGYNRRALYAREAALTVVERGVPTNEEEWRALKGVGPYMAAALAEFANHKRAIVLDTNVRRVAGRLFHGIPFPHADDDSNILRSLERTTPQTGAHWNLPQAFMDLATAVCFVRSPQCSVCPLRNDCKAAKLFLTGHAGTKPKRKVTERIHQEKRWPDRIYRGRILTWIMRRGPTKIVALGPKIDDSFDEITDSGWLRAMAGRLVKDGLLTLSYGGTLSLPKS
jgi:A/G-specific adenine glycosylase